MDLNSVLMWIVGFYAGLAFVVLAARFRGRYRGWLFVQALVLGSLLGAWWIVPERAGWMAAAVWVPLVAAPMALSRWLGRLLVHRRYAAAHRVAVVMSWLHPADGWREYPECVRILGEILGGDFEAARVRLASLAHQNSPLARFASLHLMRAEGRWQEILDRLGANGPLDPGAAGVSVEMILHYERALGETGRVEEMLTRHAAVRGRIAAGGLATISDLHVAALAGRVHLTEQLMEGPFASYPAATKSYWVAVARQVAGQTVEATRELERLAADAPPDVALASRRRLADPLPVLEERSLSDAARDALREFETSAAHELRYRSLGIPAARSLLVTKALIVANLAMFAVELRGGSENLANLVNLGALVVADEPFPGTGWRIFMAGFLHYGFAHVALNMLGIWVLGSYVERIWGRWRFVACYFAAMIGANAFATIAVRAESGDPVVMVGASGGVLGILGAGLGFALFAWIRERTALLGRQIAAFSTVLAVQMVFDVMTPVVSSTIHITGFVIGFIVAVSLSAVSRLRSDAPH